MVMHLLRKQIYVNLKLDDRIFEIGYLFVTTDIIKMLHPHSMLQTILKGWQKEKEARFRVEEYKAK